MSNSGVRLKPEALRLVAFGAINAAYTLLGAAFTHTIKMIVFINTTDKDVYVSLDGVTDQMLIIAGSQRIYDLKTNDFFLETGNTVYIKYSAVPSTGNFACEAYYG